VESGGGGRVKADINVTPLVDIVLVLLIIFIVITPAVNNAVKLPVARHSTRPGPEAKPLSLMYQAVRDPGTGRVTGPGGVLVDEQPAAGARGTSTPKPTAFDLADPATRKQLLAYIGRAMRDQQDKRVFVKADADLPFKYVNDLLALCREGGASEASIVTGEDRRPEGRP
jgi:biopolymer transport protein ExbD